MFWGKISLLSFFLLELLSKKLLDTNTNAFTYPTTVIEHVYGPKTKTDARSKAVNFSDKNLYPHGTHDLVERNEGQIK